MPIKCLKRGGGWFQKYLKILPEYLNIISEFLKIIIFPGKEVPPSLLALYKIRYQRRPTNYLVGNTACPYSWRIKFYLSIFVLEGGGLISKVLDYEEAVLKFRIKKGLLQIEGTIYDSTSRQPTLAPSHKKWRWVPWLRKLNSLRDNKMFDYACVLVRNRWRCDAMTSGFINIQLQGIDLIWMFSTTTSGIQENSFFSRG